MTDRAIQDEVIRALADAPYRGSAAWLERDLADPDRVARFARFLARRFYFERVVHFFRYSRALARVTDRWPEAALRSSAFEAIVADAVLGSRSTAQMVASLVVEYLQEGKGRRALSYLDDLHRYEGAMMIVEAGPRLWRELDRAPSGSLGADAAPKLADDAVILELEWDLPKVLPALVRDWVQPPVPARRPCRLVVARTPRGRVSVARLSDPVTDAMRHADGSRTLGELAAETGVELPALLEAFSSLSEIGAFRRSMGS